MIQIWFSGYLDGCGLYELVVRVLDFTLEGLEFGPWLGYGDFSFGQSTSHTY